ncbi:hypothetical protein BFP72_02185 [Reichenbachiella sp. 5M10]|nr:hypothetical protein BFP72_02185 [Reichenbachiella sp. 5M10]
MKVALMLVALISFSAHAQDRSVSGTVTSTAGDELPGVSVLIKGTTNGTVTNASGEYTLSVGSGDVTLVYSFIGMKQQEATVGSRSVIDISLEEDVASLQEVIVTGYSSESRAKVTSAVSSLDTQEAMKVPVTNAAEAFQGRMSGVNVVSGAQPGDAPIVRIRGYSSTGNNDPLYIVDGVQLVSSGALNDINPGDIESVNVLKDAAAASIYGARASNGVVVITTRQGKVSDKPTFTFDAYYGVQQPTNMPEMVNSQEFGEIIYQTGVNDGVASPGHPQFTGADQPVLNEYLGGDPSQPYDFDTNRVTKSSDGTDWFDEIFDPAPIQNYYISANGGNANGRYMMSAGYFNRQGTLHGTGYQRYTTRVNTSFNLSDKLRVGEHFNIAYSEQNPMPSQFNDDNPINNAYRNSVLLPIYDEGGNYAGAGAGSGLGNSRGSFSELDRAQRGGDVNSGIRFYGDAYLEYDIIKDLTARSSIGVTYLDARNKSFQWLNPEHSEPRSINSLTETNGQGVSWVWSNTLNYEKTIGNGHNLGILVGTEAVKNIFKQTQVQQDDFMFETADFFVMGAGTGATNIIQNNSFDVTNSLFSVFGQVRYDYNGKYLLSATLRNDRSSRFAKGNNSGIFPAVSAGWVISEESFLSGSNTLSFLKLRASYGQMGNQSIPVANPTVSISALNDQNAFYTFTGTGLDVGAAVSSLGNEDLTWETSSQFNVGTDFGFLDNTLTLTVEYFNIDTQDMLLNPPLPSTGSIAAPPYQNIGEMNNHGFEFELGYANEAMGGDLRYNISANLSTYKNEVTKIAAAEGTSFVGASQRGYTFTRTNEGNPVSHFYGREVEGIFQDAAEVGAHADQGFVTDADGVGRFKYKDINDDGVINDDDRTVLGSPHPDFIFGFNANIAYKAFDLSVFFNGSQGNEIYNYTKFFTDFPSFPDGARSTRVLDAWSPTNTGGSLPQLSDTYTVSNQENGVNSYFVEDGSYVRLKNVQLGYTLPKTALSKVGIASARIYVQGTNLLTFTGYDGLDPEIGAITNDATQNLNMGVDFGSFPVARTFTAGVSIDF